MCVCRQYAVCLLFLLRFEVPRECIFFFRKERGRKERERKECSRERACLQLQLLSPPPSSTGWFLRGRREEIGQFSRPNLRTQEVGTGIHYNDEGLLGEVWENWPFPAVQKWVRGQRTRFATSYFFFAKVHRGGWVKGGQIEDSLSASTATAAAARGDFFAVVGDASCIHSPYWLVPVIFSSSLPLSYS